MPGVGFNTPYTKDVNTVFIVKNISENKKRVRIFQYPVLWDKTRDLMTIPEVSEADIRHSLLKGDLKIKIRDRELTVIESNIDLLQFDDTQKQFLIDAGITDGLEVSGGSSTLPIAFKQGVALIGAVDGVNRSFYTPEAFINGILGANDFKILLRHNGRVLIQGIDFRVYESGGAGTGYDNIVITAFIPNANSKLMADYVTELT